MSQENNRQNSRSGGGQGRQGNNRNSNRNRNRNKNRNNQGGKGQGGQGRQSGGGPQNPQRRRHQKPVPLTTWEKILKFFGLYKEPTRPPRRKSGAQASEPQKTTKSNTRNARGKSESSDKGAKGGRREKRVFPVETPRLYIGNLSYDADEGSLEELFKGVGTVRSVEIVYNRHTHRSKGFGFIEMQSIDEAKRAVEDLHDQPFMGRNLVVNGANNKPKEDRPQREKKPRDSAPAQERSDKPARERAPKKRSNPARLHIDNLSYDADEGSLEELFKGVGNVRRVELVYNRQTHKSKGFGFVEMQKTEDALRAIEVLHDQPFMGRKLVVTEAKNKPARDNKPEEAKGDASTVDEATPAIEEAAPAVEEVSAAAEEAASAVEVAHQEVSVEAVAAESTSEVAAPTEVQASEPVAEKAAASEDEVKTPAE